MPNSIEAKIFAAMKTTLSTLSWVKTVVYENIRPGVEGFRENELPALQVFDNKGIIKHLRNQIECEWGISVELILKSTSAATIDQLTLLDRKADIEALIGANVDLDIPGMIHLRYDGWETDMTTPPFAVCRLDFSALFVKNFTGP